MKLQILSILLVVSLAGVAQDKKSFTLSGTITAKNDGFIYLQYAGTDGKSKRDSAIIQNGRFSFKGQMGGPQGIALAAVGGTLLTTPIALPAILVKIAGYLTVAGAVATTVSQATTPVEEYDE